MKYLPIFFFAGFLLADATDIVKYKLSLEPGKEGFQGKVTLTLSDRDNAKDLELDEYNKPVTKCTYTGIESAPNPSSTNSTTTESASTSSLANSTAIPFTVAEPPQPKQLECKFDGGKIKFPHKRTSEEVVLEFEGKYSTDGLAMYGTESKDRLYVADMTLTNHQIIFPCKQDKEAEFEFDAGHEVMSNLENLRGGDKNRKVSLRSIIFIQGDIVKDENSISSFPYYRMKNSHQMGPKLKNVMEKVSKLDASVRVLFTPFSHELHIDSRDIIILRDALNPDDSKSNYWDVAQDLGVVLFKRPRKEENAFLDQIGPVFTALKILGGDTNMDQIRLFTRLDGLEKDGFNNSASLNHLALSANHIFEHPALFPKGLSVLYSLESICGDDKFMTGLSKYIKNVESFGEEAFQACFENVDEAKEFFKAWIHKPGYPVVHVTLNKTAQYEMSQERFLWFGNKDNDRRWILPIDYKTNNGDCENIILTDKVSQKINSTYFILNHKNKGFYRVNYDAKVWEALITQLKSNHTAIDPFSRMQLVDDVFSFPKSIYNLNQNTPDYVTALKLSDYLRNETDFFALQAAFRAFHFLDSALNSSYHGKFRDHARGILSGIYESVMKKPEPDAFDKSLQAQVIPLACKYGVEKCIKNAINTFENITWDTRPSPEQEMAICSVVRNDSAKWMQSFASLTALGLSPSEKINFLMCSRDEKVLSLFISQFISQKNEGNFKKAVTAAMDNNPDNIKVILSVVNRFKNATARVFGDKCLQDIVRFTLPKLNTESAVTLKEIAKDLDKELEGEVNRACEHVEQWTNTKAKRVGDYFKGSGSQAKPIALVLLATTLIPLANHIFHN